MRWAVRAAVAGPVVFFSLCCASDEGDSSTTAPPQQQTIEVTVAEVDCFGMIYDRGGGPMGEMATSRSWSWDSQSEATVSRCVFQWAPNVEGVGELEAMRGDTLANAMNAERPFANLNIRIGGREYNSESGRLRFDEFEEGKASGTYEVVAVNLNLLTGNDDHVRATLRGEFDWCDVTRTDCPHASGNSGLGNPVTIAAPAASGSGEAVACRILHDPATQAVQVDMQLGIWNRINTAEYLLDACWDFGGPLPRGNHFQMRASGVPGPGTYDLGWRRTFRHPVNGTNPVEELRVEYFEWVTPATFEDGLPEYRQCDAFYRDMTARPPADGGGCRFTVEDGNFEIHCDEVDHLGTGFGGSQRKTGPFDLQAECAWQTR